MKNSRNLLFAVVALFAVAVISVEAGSCQKRRRCGVATRRGATATNCRGGNCRRGPVAPKATRGQGQVVNPRTSGCRSGSCQRG